MWKLLLIVLLFTVGLPLPGQSSQATTPELPKDPRAIFAAAGMFYDFNDPALKPWHLKASYQMYDDKGKPSDRGTYEYWRATPEIHRSTWSRPGMTHTDWYSANGKYAYEATGEPLSLFEYKLEALLFSPLPSPSDLRSEKFRVIYEGTTNDDAHGPCLTFEPQTVPQEGFSQASDGPFPTYCFDQQFRTLLNVYSFERVLTQFGDFTSLQGNLIPRDISLHEGKHRLFSAQIEIIDSVSPSDPAFAPDAGATRTQVGYVVDPGFHGSAIAISPEAANGFLVKKLTPSYPREALKERIQGVVVLTGTIGTDGRMHNLRVTSAPAASLAVSAFSSVSQWEYKPYELDGRMVPVDTTIKVTFALGR
jgi:TonB family protein